jgi:acetyl-CoA C-acetyltransferase
MDERRTPVLVGVAQWIGPDVDPREAATPLDAMEHVVRAASDDAGVGARALADVEAIGVAASVGLRTWNAPRPLAERLGARPRREIVTAIGGEMHLDLVDHLAREIEAGRLRSALVASTHNMRTLRRARNAGIQLDWSVDAEGRAELFGVDRPGSSDSERAYGLDRPSTVYPIFENALRAHRGLDCETHRRRVGALLCSFTRVAAANPYAWFPVERSADEITLPSADNRMVALPYTKYMNSVMETDQAAAAWLTSAANARSLGIPEDRWVYVRGGSSAEEHPWFPSERPDFAACPALRDAVRSALAQAGAALEEIDLIDLYSCFPVAVEMACEMLSLDESDPRGLTVTGGLPYAGGPGNGYTTHSLAAMVQRLRARPGTLGLLTGNGWYLTKHSALVCSTAPREKSGAPPTPGPPGEAVPCCAQASGSGRIETWTVLYDREGAPERGIVVGRLEGGERFLANTPTDREVLDALAEGEQIGRTGRVTHEDGRNRFDPVS